MFLKNDKRMSLNAAPQLLSEIAALAVRAHDRAEFRSGTLTRLQGVIPFEVAFVQSGASTAGPEPVSWGLPPLAARLLARRADTVWSELAGIRAAALGLGGVVEASGLVSADSELGRLLRSDRPLRHLCLAALEEGRTALVLGRSGDPFTRRELEMVRLALPVIGLGDRRASEVQEALGARLTPREQEIFDYVSRGYNNREIASALGTSHFTVRNQLCRLFRKVGVSGRSELVGLAAMATRRARTA
jgi:DNA-binding CsgD family transcriptional regulator